MNPVQRSRAAAWLALLALAPAGARSAGDIKPGAYCPLPAAGERPSCLEPAQAEYGGLFEALEQGELEERDLARVEADVVAGESSGNAYLALSTLSYAYYRLAQRAASRPGADPALVERLERWNGLLAHAYADSADEPYREAVREAALDIRRSAPAVRLRCVDARGEPAECDSTEAVIRGIDAAGDRVGIRGALERLVERLRGGGAE
jgi:hypothetical protein